MSQSRRVRGVRGCVTTRGATDGLLAAVMPRCFPCDSRSLHWARRMQTHCAMRTTTLSALSRSSLGACAEPALARDPTRATAAAEEVGDTDAAADASRARRGARHDRLRRVHRPAYGTSGYRGWLFTAAGASRRRDGSRWQRHGADALRAADGVGLVARSADRVNDDYRGSTDRTRGAARARRHLPRHRARVLRTPATSRSRRAARRRAEWGTRCPTGSECNRVVCIRAPCPSYCAPIFTAPAPQPGDACEEALCGPRPRSVTLMCEDGSLGGNTGRCFRREDLSCGWEIRSCPVADVYCGARLGNTCTATQFCDFPDAAMCGYADGRVCRASGGARPYSPVCSRDGRRIRTCVAQSAASMCCTPVLLTFSPSLFAVGLTGRPRAACRLFTPKGFQLLLDRIYRHTAWAP